MSKALPPVRRAVPLARGSAAQGHAELIRLTGAHDYALFESGTQALTAILQHCRDQFGGRRRRVLLPAYGCPDLVTACLGAGMQPVLVDIAAEGWGYDLQAVAAAAKPSVAAIVTVNLMGCGSGGQATLAAARACGAVLVEDSAQHLPQHPGIWIGDYQVLSFGKGKPLNLMGGGAALGIAAPASIQPASWRHGLTGSRLAGAAFNTLTHPIVYGAVLKVPGLGVGTTVYHPPKPLRLARSSLLPQLAAAVPVYRSSASYGIGAYLSHLEAWQQWGIRTLSNLQAAGDLQGFAPLRLAMLAPSRQLRDRLVSALSKAGLGATAMYQRPLPEIADIPAVISEQGPFPNASRLADALFTLPTHAAISPATVQNIHDCMGRVVGDGP